MSVLEEVGEGGGGREAVCVTKLSVNRGLTEQSWLYSTFHYFSLIVNVDCSQDLQGQVAAGEEELGQVKRQAEETEGNLRQTVEQLIEVRLCFVLFNSMSPLMTVK